MTQTVEQPQRLVNLDRVRAARRFWIGLAWLAIGTSAFWAGLHARCILAHEVAVAMAFLLGVLAWATGLGTLICARIAHVRSRRVRRIMDGYSNGQHLVHWTYGSAEWETFVASETAQRSESMWTALWVLLILAAILGFIMGIAESFIGALIMAAALCALVVLFWGLVFGLRELKLRACRRRLRKLGREVYIGQDSAYCAGETLFWDREGNDSSSYSSMALSKAAFTAGAPALIELTVRDGPRKEPGTRPLGPSKGGSPLDLVLGFVDLWLGGVRIMGRDRRLSGQGGPLYTHLHIPVPQGAEEEAKRIVEALGKGADEYDLGTVECAAATEPANRQNHSKKRHRRGR